MLQTPTAEQVPGVLAIAQPTGGADPSTGIWPAVAGPLLEHWTPLSQFLMDNKDIIQTVMTIFQGVVSIAAIIAFLAGLLWGSLRILRRWQHLRAQPPAHRVERVAASHGITGPPDDFAGRDIEIAELHNQHRRGRRVLGLFGMGGVGKTTLARRFAQEVRTTYPDAQIEIPLAGMQARPLTTEDALTQIITTLQSDLADKLPETVDELCRVFRDLMHQKRGIILLDDAAGPDQIRPILDRRLGSESDWLILVTARAAFSPDDLSPLSLPVLAPRDAEQLLTSIVPRIATEASTIAELCGYLPHALRVAGRTLAEDRTLDPATYARRLKESRNRLELGQAPLDLSYQQLSPDLRSVWRRLGVFPGSFDLAAAMFVLARDESQTEQDLAALVRRSLLDFDIPTKRYGLHDLARDFARVHLSEPDSPRYLRPLAQLARRLLPRLREERIVYLRFSMHFADFLSNADDLYLGGGDGVREGLRLFDGEALNIRAGQAWAATHAPHDDDAALTTTRYIPQRTSDLIDLRLTPTERLSWAEAAINAVRPGDDSAEMRARLVAGNACDKFKDADVALKHYARHQELARLLGDQRAEAMAFGNLGTAYGSLGEHQRAIGFYEQALAIDRELKDRRGEGNDLAHIGSAHNAMGEHRRAIDFYQQALAIRREITDRRGEGNDLANIGVAHNALDEHQRAIGYYQQALAIRRELGDRRGEAVDLANLGVAHNALGDHQFAIGFHQQALVIHRALEDRRSEAADLANLGIAHNAFGDHQFAIECHKQALAIHREHGDRRGEGNDLRNLADACLKLNQPERARTYAQLGIESARRTGYELGEGVGRFHLACALHELGDNTTACAELQQSITIFKRAGDSKRIVEAEQTLIAWGSS